MSCNHRLITPLALVLAIGAIAAPAASGRVLSIAQEGAGAATSQPASAAASDLSRLAAVHSHPGHYARTVKSSQQPSGPVGRSLPAMDSATAAVPAPVQLASTRSAEDSGFDWGDAGIGASGLLTLILLVVGSMTYLQRHRGSSRSKSAGATVTS